MGIPAERTDAMEPMECDGVARGILSQVHDSQSWKRAERELLAANIIDENAQLDRIGRPQNLRGVRLLLAELQRADAVHTYFETGRLHGMAIVIWVANRTLYRMSVAPDVLKKHEWQLRTHLLPDATAAEETFLTNWYPMEDDIIVPTDLTPDPCRSITSTRERICHMLASFGA